MEYSLDRRHDKWVIFRMYMAIRCKQQFQFHMASRNYEGIATFDHLNAELRFDVRFISILYAHGC